MLDNDCIRLLPFIHKSYCIRILREIKKEKCSVEFLDSR